MNTRTNKINEIRALLNPDNRPACLVFRDAPGNTYLHNGRQLTRQECEAIPAKIKIFVRRDKIPTL